MTNSSLTQSEAYENCLKLAAKHNWRAVYNTMMEDGFDVKMDYVLLLESWERDSEGRL